MKSVAPADPYILLICVQALVAGNELGLTVAASSSSADVLNLTSGSSKFNSPSPTRVRLAPVSSVVRGSGGSTAMAGTRSRSALGQHKDATGTDDDRPRSASSQTSQRGTGGAASKSGASHIFVDVDSVHRTLTD
jgi:hypothetical protein